MARSRGKRTFAAVVSVGSVLVIAFSLTPIASAFEVTGRLKAVGGTSVPLGEAMRLKVVLTNPTDSAVDVAFTLGIQQVGGGDPISFTRWTGSVGASSSETVPVEVTSAQWFRSIGQFRITAISAASFNSLDLNVTKATVAVPRFKDVTADVGLAFKDTAEITCKDHAFGAAWGDIEGDGDPDLFVPQQAGPSHLFINDGGQFADRAVARGVDNAGSVGISSVFVDYDNDGDPDLYVVNDGPDRLYRNDGTGRFTDMAAAAGIDAPEPGSSASWGDYDGDGYLDLYIAAWGDCDPSRGLYFQYVTDRLYHNDGDGTFTDRTADLQATGSTMGAGFEAVWFDYDHDGDPDLYVANDFVGASPKANVLWRNDGPGSGGAWTFTNASVASGTGYSMNTMGAAAADYDRDLDLDLALSNIEANRLLRNDGDGTFTDVAAYARVARPEQRVGQRSVTWGSVFADLNNDGWEDLYVPAGTIRPNGTDDQPNELFVNGGGGRFLDLSAPSRTNDPNTSRSAAIADFDGDGRLDMYVADQSGKPRLYRNVTSTTDAHWLEIDLEGTTSNGDGCGAWVVATLPSGAELLRQAFCGSSGLGTGSYPSLNFGLGSAKKVSSLDITWPSGTHQVLRNVAGDRFMTITEP